jgi:RNA-directed DNA polymerase
MSRRRPCSPVLVPDWVRRVPLGYGELHARILCDRDKGDPLSGLISKDHLDCHFRSPVSGRMLERGIRRYYLHRWPAQRSMNRAKPRPVEAAPGRTFAT